MARKREKSRPDPDPAGTVVFNWPPGSAFVNHNYGSADLGPKE